jgi:DNA-binding Lrp family transcriptional regulator
MKTDAPRQTYFDPATEQVKLDAKDKKILDQLYRNARVPLSDIARKTGIPKDSVLYRVRRLEKLGVVRYVAILNPSKIGHPIFKFVNLILHNFHPKEEERFVSFIKSHPNIIYSAKTSGRYDYTIAICAKSLRHFDEVMKVLRTEYSSIIKDFETVDILEEYKYDYMIDLIS